MKDRVMVTIFCVSKKTKNPKHFEVECEDMVGAVRCQLTWKPPRNHEIIKYEVMPLEKLV